MGPGVHAPSTAEGRRSASDDQGFVRLLLSKSDLTLGAVAMLNPNRSLAL